MVDVRFRYIRCPFDKVPRYSLIDDLSRGMLCNIQLSGSVTPISSSLGSVQANQNQRQESLERRHISPTRDKIGWVSHQEDVERR